mmetsp:Transcript_23504/g.65858  ORF Transcript_23504/g.65858 Transcript_23504/m.65858 type:complete len:431 (+) Transcript_23504:97-1389(+)
MSKAYAGCPGQVPTLSGPNARTLHKEGSSNQLFVLLEDQDSLQPQLEVGGVPAATAMGPGGQGKCGCGLKTLVAAVSAALVLAGAVVAFASQRGTGAPAPPLRSAQQNKIMIGTPHVPEELPEPPQSERAQIGHPAYHCAYSMSPTCPAKELFWNPEIYEAATENLLQVGRGLLVHADRDTVRDTVAAGFKNISDKLELVAPDIAKRLATFQVHEKQKNAVLTAMRLISMPEVQSIGFEVSLAIRHSTSWKKGTLRSEIESTLRRNATQIARLRDEDVSSLVLEALGDGHQWDMTLSPENVKIMKAFHNGTFFGSMNASFFAEFHPTNPRAIPLQEKAYGAWGAVLEQIRTVMYFVSLLAETAGEPLRMPLDVASLANNVDVEDLGSELLSCELHRQDGMNNLMKALFCPLKYGTQGLEALRAVDHYRRD